MRKIFITGGAGFVGSHLVDRLAGNPENELVIYDNLFNGKRDNIAVHLDNPRIKLVEADIRDSETLIKSCEGSDIIFHLAALSNVMNAVKLLDYSFTTNVTGTYNVLTAAKENGIRKTVFISSREVYGEPRYLPVDEGHPLDCKNSYGASKIAGEAYCQAFRSMAGMNINVLRLANVYGPRDYGRVIPLWLDGAANGKDILVYGGKQIIDFVWIGIVVNALEKLIQLDIGNEPINIGSGSGTQIIELAKTIQRLAPLHPEIKILPERAVEVVQYYASVEKMKNILGIESPDDPLFALPEMMKNLSSS